MRHHQRLQHPKAGRKDIFPEWGERITQLCFTGAPTSGRDLWVPLTDRKWMISWRKGRVEAEKSVVPADFESGRQVGRGWGRVPT